MRFIHISDVHLGKIPDEGQPWSRIREKEISETFSQVIEYANANHIDFIFIAGDLFDHVPDREELQQLDKVFGTLKHTCVIYATGESDYLQKDSALTTFSFTAPVYVIGNEESFPSLRSDSSFYGIRDENASVMFDCIYFPHFNLHVYGVSFFREKSNLPLLDEMEPFYEDGMNILVAHGGENDYLPIDFSQLKNRNYHYVALGHRHNYEKIGNTNIIFSGALEPLCGTETGRHGFVEGVIVDEDIKTQLHPVSKREYKTIAYPVSDAMTSGEIAEDIIRLLEREGKGHIYHIRLVRLNDCEKNFHIEELLKEFWIETIEGQHFERKDYEKYIKSNRNNVFSKVLDYLADASPVRQDAAKMAVDMIIEASGLNHRWSNHLSDRMYEEYRQMVLAHLKTRKDILRNSREYTEYEKAKEQLKVNPDVLESLNAAWAEERKAELSYRTMRANLDQIGKKYRLHWIKIGGRVAIFPFIVFCLICILLLPNMLMRYSNEALGYNLLLLPVFGFMAVVVSFFLGYFTSQFIDTKFGRGIYRITMQQEIDDMSAKLKDLEQQINVLHEKRREFQRLESRHQDLVENANRSERIAENICYELLLIDEALEILYNK